MRNNFLRLTLFSVLVFAACSKKTSPGKTASETPTVKATSYTADILPLMQMKCTPCHLPSKGGFKANFENYASAKTFAADMVVRIQRNPGEKGFMPFKHEKLPEAEIAIFKKWVDGGLVEN